ISHDVPAGISRVVDRGVPMEELTVWDATSGERVLRMPHVAGSGSIAFSPDGTRLATSSRDGIVRVFDVAEGRDRAALVTGSPLVTGLAFSPDGRRLYSVGWGMGGVKIFDPNRDPRGRGVQAWLEQLAALTFDRDDFRIRGIDWHRGGLLAAADPLDGSVLF